MPDQTHNYLINFEGADVSATTTIDVLIAKLEQLRATVSQTSLMMGQIGAISAQVPAGMPTTAPSPSLGQESPMTYGGMIARWQTLGFPREATMRAARAQDELSKSIEKTGRTAQKSGHWLGNYIQRYLIRYLVVWQGMVAIKAGIRDWAQAHEDAERAMFRLQTTMGLTTSQAERYMNAMRGASGGISGAQLAGGAMQLGQTGAGMAGQFGAMTGIGAGEGMGFFAGIKRQYDLTNAEIERLIPRMFAAFARSGQDIQTFMKNWEEMLAQFDAGSAAVGEWTRAQEIYETTGTRASERVSAAWTDFLSVLGDMQVIIDLKNAFADLFSEAARGIEWTGLPRAERDELVRQYARETGLSGYTGLGWFLPDIYPQVTPEFSQWLENQPTGGPTTTAHEQWRLTGESPAAQSGIGFVASGYERMTQAQYAQYEKLTGGFEQQMEGAGLRADDLKQQIVIAQEGNLILKTIDTNVLASALALDEMNERQRGAVWNWPGNTPLILMPGAMNQVSAPYPPQQRSGPGGIDRPWPPIIMKTEVAIDGKKVGESTNTIMGDQYTRAARASGGGGGAYFTPD